MKSLPVESVLFSKSLPMDASAATIPATHATSNGGHPLPISTQFDVLRSCTDRSPNEAHNNRCIGASRQQRMMPANGNQTMNQSSRVHRAAPAFRGDRFDCLPAEGAEVRLARNVRLTLPAHH